MLRFCNKPSNSRIDKKTGVGLLFIFLFYIFNAGVNAEDEKIKGSYAVNLLSSHKAIHIEKEKLTELANSHVVYTTSTREQGKIWHRLRLGFFDSRIEAIKAKNQLREQYPRAWTVKVSAAEMKTALAARLTSVNNKSKPEPKPITSVDKPQLTGTEEKLMRQGKQALILAKYQAAIQIFTVLLEKNKQNPEAIEYLGLARERNGQIAHAKAEYERYLELYPDTKGAARVQQRLIGLITAASAPTKIIKKNKANKKSEWMMFGGLSQFYYRDERTTETESRRLDVSQLVSTLDITTRKRDATSSERVQLTADHVQNFITSDGNYRFTRLYYENIDRKENREYKLGRQTHSSGGVLGRFDGAIVGFDMTSNLKFTGAGGYLLDSEDLLDFKRDKKFISTNLDIATAADEWDFNVYAIQQWNRDVLDRRALGMESRFFNTSLSVFSLLDYDIYFDELNIFLVNGNWILEDQSTVFVNADVRKTPSLSASNALQGQTAQNMDDLQLLYSEAEIKQLALDRTATSRTLTIGGSMPLAAQMKYLFSGDITVANTTGMPASGGVQAVPDTGNEYYLGLQLIGNSLMIKGDSTILGFRFGDTRTTDTFSLSINSRLPNGKKWRFNPRLRYSLRDNNSTGDKQTTTRYSLRVDYRFKRNLSFESELGQEHVEDEVSATTQKSELTFLNIGYRWDF